MRGISLKHTHKQSNVKQKSPGLAEFTNKIASHSQSLLKKNNPKLRKGQIQNGEEKISCYDVRMILNLCSIDSFRPKDPTTTQNRLFKNYGTALASVLSG